MASSRYYNNASYMDYLSIPLPLFCFMVALFLFLGFSWYLNYESRFEDFFDQLRLILMISPLMLLLIVRWLSSAGDEQRLTFPIPLPEQESLHRAGGSPWGVGCLLVILLLMLSYQSSFHERWFPFST